MNSNQKNQLVVSLFIGSLPLACGIYAAFHAGVDIFVLVVGIVALVVGYVNFLPLSRYIDQAMPTDILCDPVSFYGRYLVPTARGMATVEIHGVANNTPSLHYRVVRKMDQVPNQYLNGHNDEFCFFPTERVFVFDSLPEAFASLERWQKKVSL